MFLITVFTFQYGEIKSPVEKPPKAALREFTFQYGEIKSFYRYVFFISVY